MPPPPFYLLQIMGTVCIRDASGQEKKNLKVAIQSNAAGIRKLGGSGGMPPRENFEF